MSEPGATLFSGPARVRFDPPSDFVLCGLCSTPTTMMGDARTCVCCGGAGLAPDRFCRHQPGAGPTLQDVFSAEDEGLPVVSPRRGRGFEAQRRAGVVQELVERARASAVRDLAPGTRYELRHAMPILKDGEVWEGVAWVVNPDWMQQATWETGPLGWDMVSGTFICERGTVPALVPLSCEDIEP